MTAESPTGRLGSNNLPNEPSRLIIQDVYYYPQLLTDSPLINCQVIFPGGWNLDMGKAKPYHYALEACLLCPDKNISDIDKFLWENTEDYWTITSYESIRINITCTNTQLKTLLPFFKILTQARKIEEDFFGQEMDDIKNTWTTERDLREDKNLQTLFKSEDLVHPQFEQAQDFREEDKVIIQNLWDEKIKNHPPHLIVLGGVKSEEIKTALDNLFPQDRFSKTEVLPKFKETKIFLSDTQWGLKISLTSSRLLELFIIEYLDDQLKIKFFFEYHQDDLFIWTESVEIPKLINEKIKNHIPSLKLFEKTKQKYLTFLNQIYAPQTATQYEKLAEIIEGLHAHTFQAPTYEIQKTEDLNLIVFFENLRFEDFDHFYQKFTKSC